MVKLQKGQSIYEAIGVEKNADAAAIRKAYLKLAVQLHPDKNPGDEEAKERFQTLQKIYSILSDPEKRKIYDRTGSLEDTEELSGEEFDHLYSFYRSKFAAVTEESINLFASTYQGGVEERADLLRHYKRFQGNMKIAFEYIILSDPERDCHRFKDIIDAAIKAGEVQEYKPYTKWAAKVAKKKPFVARQAAKEEKNGTKRGKKSSSGPGEGSGCGLMALMASRNAQRQGAFEGMLSIMSKKYGVGDEMPPEPTDEEFEAARKRIEATNKGLGKKRRSDIDGDGEGGSTGGSKRKKLFPFGKK